MSRTPLKSDYNTDSLAEIQRLDGLYGVMLAAMRNLEENAGREMTRESVSLMARRCLKSAVEEFITQG